MTSSSVALLKSPFAQGTFECGSSKEFHIPLVVELDQI